MQVQPTHQDTGFIRTDVPSELPSVLIVDDEIDIVEAVVEMLEYEGVTCLSAVSAQAALDLVQSDASIGVVVTDIRMPGMDGLEMARQLKAKLAPERDVFIIVVTGHAGMKEAVEALKLGAEDFLTKPISPDHLLHSVRRAGEMVQLRQHERGFQKHLAQEVKIKTDDLNAANDKLLAANCIKDQFLSVMGHELRTPLNAINGFAELLKVKLQGSTDAVVFDYIDHILESGARLSGTVENILEFATAISGSRKIHTQPQVLEDILGNVSASFTKPAAAKDITLELSPFEHDLLVEVDGSMLVKALGCVVDNAIKFSPPGSTIVIGAERDSETVKLFVRDNGCGMSADEITIALEPLNQVDSGLTRPAEGAGMGLSLAGLLIQLQGGGVQIDSTPGEGTTVNIELRSSQPAPVK